MPDDDLDVLPTRKPTKQDIELIQLFQSGRRWDLGINWAGRILWTVAASLPLWMIYRGVDSLAGEKTEVNATVAVSISVTLAGVNAGQFLYARYLRGEITKRDKEIKRLKERLRES